jgi:regulator of replication initiation timing
MDKFIEKIFEIVGDPTIIVIISAFIITIIILWRFFNKQHQFIKERLDLMRQENEDLRKQLSSFKEENEKLRIVTNSLNTFSNTLQKQPLLSEETTISLKILSEKTKSVIEFNEDLKHSIFSVIGVVRSEIQSQIYSSEKSSKYIYDGIKELENIISKKERTNEEISIVINKLVDYINTSASEKNEQLKNLKEMAQRLLER